MHYQGRAIDLGGWSPSSPEGGGRDEQAPIIKALLEWNQQKGVSPVQLIHGSPAYKNVGSYRVYPDSHHHHVHVAYHKGGEVLGKGERWAKLLGGEMVIDIDSAGPAKDLLLAINQASGRDGVMKSIRDYAPYEAIQSRMIPVPVERMVPVPVPMGSSGGGVAVIGGGGHDPFSSLALNA